MSHSSYQAEIILKLNSRLFTNALDAVTEEQAMERLSDHNNPLIWIATHTVWARYNMSALLGKPTTNPYESMFENFKPYDPADTLPSLAEVKAAWEKATKQLEEAFAGVNEEQLAAEAPFKNPIGDFSIGGTIAFLAQHESYDIGQMALLKKYFTNEAMKY